MHDSRKEKRECEATALMMERADDVAAAHQPTEA